MAVKNVKILKVAGLSFLGFCAVSLAADRSEIGPVASQLAGFCGAFFGGWVGTMRKRAKPNASAAPKTPSPEIVALNSGRDAEHTSTPTR